MLIDILYIILGAALLYFGGEGLVRGASSLARALGISSLVIGLTVVAFATSCPELFSALVAALKDEPDIALGTVIGSNIANIGLVLGLTAIIFPLAAQRKFIRREVPIMIISGALLFPICWNGIIGRSEGAFFILLLIGFLLYQVRKSRQDSESHPLEAEIEKTPPQLGRSVVFIVVGVVLLVFGAHFLIEGATAIATAIGISERVIGLTVVAFGTSLPEIASSIIAAIRREPDMVLGNLVGSNIFNVLCILGITTVVCPISVNWAASVIDLLVMLFITFLVFPFLSSGYRLQRREGFVLVTLYLAYASYLVISELSKASL